MTLGFAALIAGVAPLAAPPVSPETAVFAALFDGIGMGALPDTLLFGDSTLQFPLPANAVSALRAHFDSIPSQLLIRLEEISRTRSRLKASPYRGQ
jgi:hypothetical protein